MIYHIYTNAVGVTYRMCDWGNDFNISRGYPSLKYYQPILKWDVAYKFEIDKTKK